MALSRKGKFCMFCLLLFFSYINVSSTLLESESCSVQSTVDHDLGLEPVSEGESKSKSKRLVLQENVKKGGDDDKSKRSSEVVGENEFDGETLDGKRARGMSVTKFTPFWSERFEFVYAVKLDSEATCINVLPFRDHEGLSKYVAVSDERGRVYVFLQNGDVLVEFHTGVESPITAMVSYTLAYKNESFVVIGHGNGEILIHRVWEGSDVEDWSSLFMENVGKFMSQEDGFQVSRLEVHYVGRMLYILSADTSRKIKVFKENGKLYGSAMPTSRPLVFLKQRLMFLIETRAGSLDLRGMKIKESECEGLNHSVARNYVFDATKRSKAYGITSAGDLIHVLLLGDVMNFKCRVRYKKKFDMNETQALQAIKRYLLIVNPEKVFVYNVSSPHYVRFGVSRHVFSSSLDNLRSSFLNNPAISLDAETRVTPLIASDREKLVIVGLGGGYVGIYHSNLPIFKGEFNTMLWTSPVLFFIFFLFGAWHFFAKKKEALTLWGPTILLALHLLQLVLL